MCVCVLRLVKCFFFTSEAVNPTLKFRENTGNSTCPCYTKRKSILERRPWRVTILRSQTGRVVTEFYRVSSHHLSMLKRCVTSGSLGMIFFRVFSFISSPKLTFESLQLGSSLANESWSKLLFKKCLKFRLWWLESIHSLLRSKVGPAWCAEMAQNRKFGGNQTLGRFQWRRLFFHKRARLLWPILFCFLAPASYWCVPRAIWQRPNHIRNPHSRNWHLETEANRNSNDKTTTKKGIPWTRHTEVRVCVFFFVEPNSFSIYPLASRFRGRAFVFPTSFIRRSSGLGSTVAWISRRNRRSSGADGMERNSSRYWKWLHRIERIEATRIDRLARRISRSKPWVPFLFFGCWFLEIHGQKKMMMIIRKSLGNCLMMIRF